MLHSKYTNTTSRRCSGLSMIKCYEPTMKGLLDPAIHRLAVAYSVVRCYVDSSYV